VTVVTQTSPGAERSGRLEGDADLDQLRADLQAMVSDRVTAEREGERIDFVLRAIAVARRDRDAARSAGLLRHRALFEQLMRDVEDAAVGVSRLVVRLATLRAPEDSPVAREARAAGQQALDALQALAAALHDQEQPTSGGRA
jgi:hypothetical protein